MKTMVEVTDKLGLEYYYLAVDTARGWIELENPHELCKTFYRKLPILLLDQVDVSERDGVERLSIIYGGEQYTFIDYGNGVVAALRQNIYRKIM